MAQTQNNPQADTLYLSEEEITPEVTVAAHERQMTAIRRAHESIASRELKMRKWLINRNLIAELYADGKPTLLGRCLKLATASACAVGITQFAAAMTPVIALATATGVPAAKMAGNLGGFAVAGLLSAKGTLAEKMLNAPFLGVRAWDSMKLWWQLRAIDNAKWFDTHVSAISDHKFANSREFLELCKTVVESAHAEKTTPQLTEQFKLTSQHTLWAKDLAIRAAEFASTCERAGFTPTLWNCLNYGLKEAPWATKTIAKLDIVDKTETDQTAFGQYDFKIDYQNKIMFSNKPTVLDKPLLFNFAQPLTLRQAGALRHTASVLGNAYVTPPKTRLGSLSARFENQMLDNKAYQALIANSALSSTAVALASAAVMSVAFSRGNTSADVASIVAPLTEAQSIGAFCSQQILLVTPSFLARMIDRTSTACIHAVNRATLKWQVSKLNRTDPWVRMDYETIKANVEEKYAQQFDPIVRKQFDRISEQTMKINAEFYVARTIERALDTKIMMPKQPLEAIINGIIKDVCLERSKPVKLSFEGLSEEKFTASVFAAKVKTPNLEALGKSDPSTKNTTPSL